MRLERSIQTGRAWALPRPQGGNGKGEGRVTEGLAWVPDFILKATRKSLRVCVVEQSLWQLRGEAGQPSVGLTKGQTPGKLLEGCSCVQGPWS